MGTVSIGLAKGERAMFAINAHAHAHAHARGLEVQDEYFTSLVHQDRGALEAEGCDLSPFDELGKRGNHT